MKLISFVSGSSEETLLNARAELSNIVGKGILSTESEKRYVFDKLVEDMQRFFSIEEVNNMHTAEIIGRMIDIYISNQETKFVQIFNRVMVYYYNYDFNDHQTLVPALFSLSNDFEQFIREYYI